MGEPAPSLSSLPSLFSSSSSTEGRRSDYAACRTTVCGLAGHEIGSLGGGTVRKGGKRGLALSHHPSFQSHRPQLLPDSLTHSLTGRSPPLSPTSEMQTIKCVRLLFALGLLDARFPVLWPAWLTPSLTPCPLSSAGRCTFPTRRPRHPSLVSVADLLFRVWVWFDQVGDGAVGKVRPSMFVGSKGCPGH